MSQINEARINNARKTFEQNTKGLATDVREYVAFSDDLGKNVWYISGILDGEQVRAAAILNE